MRLFKSVCLCLSVVILSTSFYACSLEPKKNNTDMTVDIGDIIKTTQSSKQESPFNVFDYDIGTRAIPTGGLANFLCYGVNVTGPGIPDTGNGPTEPALLPIIHQKLITRQSYCAYRGVISPPFFPGSLNTTVNLQVPSGPARVVQVIGSYSADQCSTNFNGGGGSGPGLDIYEIGRSVLDTFNDASINIQNEWPTGATAAEQADRLARVVDCGDCENFSLGQGLSNLTASWAIGTYFGVAQKIQIMKPGRVQRVHFYAKTSTGSPTIRVRLFSDNDITSNVAPSAAGSLGYATASTVSLTTTFDEYVAQFAPGGQYLSPGFYWLVFEFGGTGNPFFGGDGTSVYVGVQAFMGGSWTTQNSIQNLFFKVLNCD